MQMYLSTLFAVKVINETYIKLIFLFDDFATKLEAYT